MQRQNILLISGNYYPELTGIGKYNGEMINWLADNGFNCTVISTYPYYPFWKIQEPYIKKHKWFYKEILVTSGGNRIIVHRCPHYIPTKPTGKKRMLLDFSFFVFAGLKLIRFSSKKFDYIINVTPPLSLGFLAAAYKNISKAKFLYHIQDLQVDVANDLKMISSKKLINLLFSIENYILKKADVVSTISAGMKQKIKNKTSKPIYVLPNWVNTELFYPLHNKKDLKKSFGFKPDVPLVLYSGSIGEKQGLEVMLEVARFFMQEKIIVQFVICGGGPYQNTLNKIANEKQLNNFSFLPLQPIEKLNDFLNMADVHLIIQKANVADQVMPSKLTTILSVGGLAIITANEDSGLYKEISDNNIGMPCPAEDVNALSKTIKKALFTDNTETIRNARRYAECFLSIDKIMMRFKNSMLNNVKDNKVKIS